MIGSRIFSNTIKHIKRSGWIGWASVSVMTLAFFVSSVFAGLAYISNLYIQFIERRSNLIVFFEVGMEKEIIDDLRSKWEEVPEIKSIEYTSETEAYDLYADYAERVLPETYEVLKEQEDQRLNSSLDIQLNSLDDFETVAAILRTDIGDELQNLIIEDLTNEEVESSATSEEDAEEGVSVMGESDLSEEALEEEALPVDEDESSVLGVSREVTYQYSQDPSEPPIVLAVDSDSIEGQREAFFWMRVGGIVVISMLFVVVFFFTFMTVEFRLYNQMEEIGVMQLVGGSLFFIRSPYILEGGFYGFMGALLSSGAIAGIYFTIFEAYGSSQLAFFLVENFSKLPWPEITALHAVGIVGGLALVGFFVGAASSYLSIRRYIR